VLIGTQTYEQLLDCAIVEERTGLRIKARTTRSTPTCFSRFPADELKGPSGEPVAVASDHPLEVMVPGALERNPCTMTTGIAGILIAMPLGPGWPTHT
jgi:hypothetical protein